jgi:hypothetical protein
VLQLHANRTFPYILKRSEETLQPEYVEPPSPSKRRLAAPSADLTADGAKDLLHSLVSTASLDSALVAQLEQSFATMSLAALQALVDPLSKEIVDRVPTGQHWGARDDAGDRSQGDNAYKMVQLMVSQKFQQHQVLVEILQSVVSSSWCRGSSAKQFDRCVVAQGAFKRSVGDTAVSRAHQQIALAYGLCNAIHQSQAQAQGSASIDSLPGGSENAAFADTANSDLLVSGWQWETGSDAGGSTPGVQAGWGGSSALLHTPAGKLMSRQTPQQQTQSQSSLFGSTMHARTPNLQSRSRVGVTPGTAGKAGPQRTVGYSSLSVTAQHTPGALQRSLAGPQSPAVTGSTAGPQAWSASSFAGTAGATPHKQTSLLSSALGMSFSTTQGQFQQSQAPFGANSAASKHVEKSFLEASKKEGLRAISEGFGVCVCELRGHLKSEYEAKGLSTADMLFAQVTYRFRPCPLLRVITVILVCLNSAPTSLLHLWGSAMFSALFRRQALIAVKEWTQTFFATQRLDACSLCSPHYKLLVASLADREQTLTSCANCLRYVELMGTMQNWICNAFVRFAGPGLYAKSVSRDRDLFA